MCQGLSSDECMLQLNIDPILPTLVSYTLMISPTVVSTTASTTEIIAIMTTRINAVSSIRTITTTPTPARASLSPARPITTASIVKWKPSAIMRSRIVPT